MRFRSSPVSAALLLLSTLALLLAGCGGSSTGNGTGQAAPDSKQVLRYPFSPDATDIKTLDPGITIDFYSFQAEEVVFPSLITLDHNFNLVPWAAQSMPAVSDGGLTYTFKLRPNMKWSDGTPIDANTFAYSLNRSLDPCVNNGSSSPGSSYLYPIKGAAAFNSSKCDAKTGSSNPVDSKSLIGSSIIAQDPQTLVIHLEKPYAYFLDTLTTTVAYAQPKQLIDKYGLNWVQHLADNGGFGGNLYKVTLWDHKGNLTLQRNDSFWGTKPKLREIDIKIYKQSDTIYNDFENGQLDTTGSQGISPSQYPQAKAKQGFHQAPWLSIDYMQPNWQKAPFDDLRARQAFELAIDKDSIANNVLKGADTPTNHIVPVGEHDANPNLKGVDGASTAGDPAKAHQLILEYAKDKCGGDITKCTPVTLFSDNGPTATAAGQAMLQMWQQAMPGYPIRVQTTDFNSYLGQVYSGDPPQFALEAWTLDYPDAQDWLSLQFLPGGSNNVGNVNDAKANPLMQQADVEQNEQQRISLYNQAEQILVQDVAWGPYVQSKVFWISSPHLANYALSEGNYPTVDTWQQVYLTQ